MISARLEKCGMDIGKSVPKPGGAGLEASTPPGGREVGTAQTVGIPDGSCRLLEAVSSVDARDGAVGRALSPHSLHHPAFLCVGVTVPDCVEPVRILSTAHL